jgi:hypothetical protein
MKLKIIRIMSFLIVIVMIQACGLTPTALPVQKGTVPPTQQGHVLAGTATPALFVAENDGPAGFSATLAAPDIVQLSWETVANVVGYKLQVVANGQDPLTIAYLPQDATHYEHFLAPESSLLTYRLQTITSSGPAGASSLQVATQSHVATPLAVQASFSENEAVSAVIGPGGGRIEISDARGVTYTLVIPPAALTTDLEIKMIPVNAIDGWPLDGNFLGGVRLEPEGWLLNEVAFLTIRLPDALSPDLTTVGFAFNGSGDEFHLTPAYPELSTLAKQGTGGIQQARPARQQDSSVSSLPVVELKPAGVGETSADAAAAMAVEHAPTNASDTVDQKAAATDAEVDDLTPLLSNTELVEIATNNLMSQILNDVHDCYDFKRAVGSFQGWESKVAGLGDTSGSRETIMEQLAEKAVETIEKAGQDCAEAKKGVVPGSVPCAEKLIGQIQSPSNSFYTDLQQNILKNAELKQRFTDADNTSELCPHSFSVNETASLGYTWKSGCIPSLDRPYQVAWIGTGLEGIYRLYPKSNDPFSGRMEGQAKMAMAGTSLTIVYDGTYIIKVIEVDQRGYPTNMDTFLTYKQTITACGDGICNTVTEDGEHRIPLLVRNKRCSIP